MLTVTLTRTALDLPNLVLPGEAAGTGVFVSSLTRPGRAWRRTYAGSPYLHGSVQTHATLDVASIAMTVGVRAATASGLALLRDEVDAAFGQFMYTMTVDEDDDDPSYECDCADVTWNEYKFGMASALVSTATLTIPCYPLPVGGA